MALTWPLGLSTFWSRLPVATGRFRLTEAYRHSITGGGHVRAEDQDTRLWTAEARIAVMTLEESRDLGTLLDALRQAQGTFLAYDPNRPWPQDDPGGAGLGGSAPVIDGLPAAANEIRLSGLPANYRLRRGDLFAYTHSSPVRHALHAVLDDVVDAGPGGLTPIFEIAPAREAGPVGGEPVTLLNPAAKFLIVPGTYSEPASPGPLIRNVSFTLVQSVA